MVLQASNRHKSASRDDNSSRSSSSSSSSSSPPSPSPTRTPSESSSTSHTNRNNPSGKPPPRPPPPPPRPAPPPPRSSYSRSSNSTSSGSGTLPNNIPFSVTPAGRFFTQFFDEAMRYFDYPMHDISWSDVPPITNGNSVSENVIDNDEIFRIEMDLSDFRLEELSISYDEEARELLIEGHQKAPNDSIGSVERQFQRKFDIPIDAHDGAFAAYLTPNGLLTVQTTKKGVKHAVLRIPIQAVSGIPDPVNRNAAKAQASGSSSHTADNAAKTAPATPPKPEKKPNVKEQKPPPRFRKMSGIAGKISHSQKSAEEEEEKKEPKFDQIHEPTTKKPAVKREYLNIFC